MTFIYQWKANRHQRKAEKYLNYGCRNLYFFHIDKARYYASKAGAFKQIKP